MSMTEGLARRLFAAVLFLCSLPALGSSGAPGPDQIPEIRAPGAFFQPKAGQERTSASPSDLVQASARLTAAERHDLGPLTTAERIRLQPEPSSSGRQREKIGIARDLPQRVVLASLPSGLAAGTGRSHAGGIAKREADGRLSWTTAFISPGAAAVRLHITEAYLPSGSRAFVYTSRGEVHGPYSFEGGIGPEGFWTHSVAGEQVYLEVQFSGAADAQPCRLAVSQVGHLARSVAAGLAPEAVAAPEDTSCFKDETCMTTSDFGPINSVSRAVAALEFADTGGFFLCSGGLIGALGDTTTPYLLTANHCFDNQASATSLQAFFNFKNTACNQQPYPTETAFPSTLGSTLLATGTSSDFTLVRLSQSPPSGAYLLGWSTQDVSTSDGTKIYRLSHPAPGGIAWPQFFTRAGIVASPLETCGGDPVGNYLYSTQDIGGTSGGSSGSPVLLADGSVVGQLLGKCGTDTSNPCNPAGFYQLDGAFHATYPSVAQWLSPSGTGACATAGSALCLNNGRFRITASWQSSTASGSGTPIQLTTDTGYFWFFNSANVEMVIKVLNACTLISRYWVFAGGLTNVNVTVTVTDTQTGAVRTYVNPQGTAFQPIQDTGAFSTCP
jgi:hypothetical protein